MKKKTATSLLIQFRYLFRYGIKPSTFAFNVINAEFSLERLCSLINRIFVKNYILKVKCLWLKGFLVPYATTLAKFALLAFPWHYFKCGLPSIGPEVDG
ncbi:hypothetical protein CEXT_155191 [Caerostris extrusa]|uniref:Uncharacterized protein n=1 Tax=Caerostris extrusa TaxID=172846 RepID=A0AAV4XD53_CAEEX|nr:hypothetical protein CEXT_155191 [Caerostris extrusa]